MTDRFDFLKKGYEEALEEIALGAELVRALRHGPSLEKKADGEESTSQLGDLANQARSYNAVNYGLLGAGAGAGVGLLRGLMSKKKRQLLRDALTGALAGGAIGAGAGGLTDALGQSKKDDKPATPQPPGTRPLSGPPEAGRMQRLTTDFLHRSGSNPEDVQQAVRRHTEAWHDASARATALERSGRQDEARALREQAGAAYTTGLASVSAAVDRNRSDTNMFGRAYRAFTSPGLGYVENAQEGLAELDPGLKHALPWTDAFERSHQTHAARGGYGLAGALAAASGVGAYGLMQRRQNTSLLREALQGQLRTQGPVKDQLSALGAADPTLQPLLTGLAGHTGQIDRSLLGGRVGSTALPNGPTLSRPQTSALLGVARTANNQLGRPVGPSRKATTAVVGAGATLPLLGYGLYRRFTSPVSNWNTGQPAVADQASVTNRIVAEERARRGETSP